MSYYPGDEEDSKKKKKKKELTEGNDMEAEELIEKEYKDEHNEASDDDVAERVKDKEGKSKGNIAKGMHKGKKMSLAKMKVLQKMSKRLATSKGKVY